MNKEQHASTVVDNPISDANDSPENQWASERIDSFFASFFPKNKLKKLFEMIVKEIQTSVNERYSNLTPESLSKIKTIAENGCWMLSFLIPESKNAPAITHLPDKIIEKKVTNAIQECYRGKGLIGYATKCRVQIPGNQAKHPIAWDSAIMQIKITRACLDRILRDDSNTEEREILITYLTDETMPFAVGIINEGRRILHDNTERVKIELISFINYDCNTPLYQLRQYKGIDNKTLLSWITDHFLRQHLKRLYNIEKPKSVLMSDIDDTLSYGDLGNDIASLIDSDNFCYEKVLELCKENYRLSPADISFIGVSIKFRFFSDGIKMISLDTKNKVCTSLYEKFLSKGLFVQRNRENDIKITTIEQKWNKMSKQYENIIDNLDIKFPEVASNIDIDITYDDFSDGFPKVLDKFENLLKEHISLLIEYKLTGEQMESLKAKHNLEEVEIEFVAASFLYTNIIVNFIDKLKDSFTDAVKNYCYQILKSENVFKGKTDDIESIENKWRVKTSRLKDKFPDNLFKNEKISKKQSTIEPMDSETFERNEIFKQDTNYDSFITAFLTGNKISDEYAKRLGACLDTFNELQKEFAKRIYYPHNEEDKTFNVEQFEREVMRELLYKYQAINENNIEGVLQNRYDTDAVLDNLLDIEIANHKNQIIQALRIGIHMPVKSKKNNNSEDQSDNNDDYSNDDYSNDDYSNDDYSNDDIFNQK